MNLFELRSQFGGAAVVAGAENKIEKFFEGGGMTRGAAQNGLEQSDGLLRETVAGKQVYVGERLRDECLRLLVELRIECRCRSLQPVSDSRTKPAYIGAQPGRGSLGYFGSQMILGNRGGFVRDIGCRRQAQFTQKVVEFAFRRITVGLAFDELLKDWLGALVLLVLNEGIAQLGEGIGHVEGITGAAVMLDEPCERLKPAGHSFRQRTQHFSDGLVLASIGQRDARLVQNPHGLLRLPGLEKSLDDLLQRTIVLRVRFEDLHRQRDRLIPAGILEMEIEQQFGLLAALFEIGNLLEEVGGLGGVALQRIRTRADDERGGVAGLKL